MKLFLTTLICIMAAHLAAAQTIPNGDFEIWDTTLMPTQPVGWLTNANAATLPCSPPPNNAKRSPDSHNGKWAVELQSTECIDDLGREQIYAGFVTAGNIDSFLRLSSGITYRLRPELLNFFYKFQPVGSDTAFAKIGLLTIDSTGRQKEIIGEGSAVILEQTETYRQLNVPITYFSSADPEVLQVTFTTSKTLFEQNLLNAAPGSGANAGTTLWIDDARLKVGVTSTRDDPEIQSVNIYPNPMDNQSVIAIGNHNEMQYDFELFDQRGVRVLSINGIASCYFSIQRQGLPSGIYFFRISAKNKPLKTGVLVIK